MSDQTANTSTTTQTTSGMKIGLIVGGVVLAVLLIGLAIFFIRKRRQAAAAVPTSSNGLGVLNKGPNVVPRTNVNLNAGRNTLPPSQ